ncbi:hypothetical protein PIB30_002434 [Stylosanthes scabra]|uniref:Uncharacterized protein n=1 Tax=Stylosanthes scabra TaxID=79078 RepID=A0ABU6W156_9FABA|nr:hypothetical protein [Stylosanthes scabra]
MSNAGGNFVSGNQIRGGVERCSVSFFSRFKESFLNKEARFVLFASGFGNGYNSDAIEHLGASRFACAVELGTQLGAYLDLCTLQRYIPQPVLEKITRRSSFELIRKQTSEFLM